MMVILVFLLLSPGLDGQFWKRWKHYIKKERPTFEEIQAGFAEYWEKSQFKYFGRWKQFKRWECFVEKRLDSTGHFNPILNWKGCEEKNARFNAANKNVIENIQWVELGPVHLPNIYCPDGYRGMSRLNRFAFLPQDAGTIYVGSASGGLWKTVDEGAYWLNLTDNPPNLEITSIVIPPLDPGIIYIETGDADGNDTFSYGILKSINEGQTWIP